MTLHIELSETIKHLKKRIVTGSSKKTMIFLESTENVDSFLALKNADTNTDFLCIATTPEICFILDKKNQKYVSVDEFITIEEIIELGLLNFLNVEKYCEIIDSQICSDYPIFKKYSLKPALDNYQFFKILFDEISIKIKTLENIMKQESPSLILSFSKKKSNNSSKYVPFQYDEHLFDLLLKQEGWSHDHISILESISIKTDGITKGKRFILTYLKIRIRIHCPTLYNAISICHNYGVQKTMFFIWNTLKNAFRHKKTACIVGFGYDWDLIITELARNQYNIFYMELHQYAQKTGKIAGINFPRDQIRKLCITGNIDATNFIIGSSIPRIADAIDVAAEYPQKIENFLIKYKPCVILCSTKSNFSDCIPAHVAQVNKIPVVSWQHGASGFFSYYPILKYTELSGSDIHLVWGAGVKRQIEQEFPSNGCKIVPSGSFTLQEAFVDKTNKKHCRVLYVTTNYFHNTLYVGYSHKVQDLNFWNTQKKIIDALGSFDIPTVFKIHPSTHQPQLFHDYIQWKKFKQITIIQNEKRFPSLLEGSEIIIIDFPSTTLLQAIAAKKTVFVLLKHAILTSQAKDLLRKRVYWYEEPDELVEAVRKYLNNETLDQSPDPENTEFLEEYGIYKTDGNVAARAMDTLNAIMSGAYQ